VKKSTLLFLSMILMAAPAAFAAVGDGPTITHFAFGYSAVQGDASDFVDDGWNISGGVTIMPNPQKPFGIRFDVAYNWWDIDPQDISDSSGVLVAQVDDGSASMFSVTSQALFNFGGDGKLGGYLAVGIGGYSRYANLSTTAYTTGIYCDWWYCYPATVSGQVVVADDRLTKFGYNAGLGLTFELASGSQFYLEVQYHYMISDPATEYMPILVGWRF